MEQLAKSVKAILQHRDVDVVNRGTPSSLTDVVTDNSSASPNLLQRQSSSDADSSNSVACVECSSSTAAASITLAETLITQLVLVLSDGLWPGLDIWSVLVALERCQNLSPPSLAHSYRFATQMILLIRSSFASASECIKTRAFMRCALNQGCLLAALEVLGRQYQPILEGYMMDQAVLRQYSTGSDKWDRFVRVVAPIAGPPLDLLVEAPHHNNGGGGGGGVPNDSLSAVPLAAGPVRFDLDLVVPEFDYCKPYMNDVKLYIAGLTDVAAPPALPIRVVAAPTSAPRSDDTTDAPLQASTVETTPRTNCNTIVYQDPTSAETPRTSSANDDKDVSPRNPAAETTTSTAAAAVSPPPKVIKRTVRKVVVTKRVIKRNGSIVASLPTTTVVGGGEQTADGDGLVEDTTSNATAEAEGVPAVKRCEEDEAATVDAAPSASLAENDNAQDATPASSARSDRTEQPATNNATANGRDDGGDAVGEDKNGTGDAGGGGAGSDPEMEAALDILEQLILRRRAAIEGAIAEYERTEALLDRETRLLEVQLGSSSCAKETTPDE